MPPAEADVKALQDAANFLFNEVYHRTCRPPTWSLDLMKGSQLSSHFSDVRVYYPKGADLETVKRLVREREPVNIAMQRHYDAEKLHERFGYSLGAYAGSTPDQLMPNIAIYCRTPMRSPRGEDKDVHVINVIGFAFDSPEQPDWQYFLRSGDKPRKREELVRRMGQMWRYVFFCAREKGKKRVLLAAVGGGAFSAGLRGALFGYDKLKEDSLALVTPEFHDIEVASLPRIPDWVFSAEGQQLADDTLLVNAWDPWSMVGNGNAADNSLDGFFGRSTAMAILCWPHTNPYLVQSDCYVPVAAPREEGPCCSS